MFIPWDKGDIRVLNHRGDRMRPGFRRAAPTSEQKTAWGEVGDAWKEGDEQKVFQESKKAGTGCFWCSPTHPVRGKVDL
jgi:hypothetical protein